MASNDPRTVASRVTSTLVRVTVAAVCALLAVAASVWVRPYLGDTPYALLYVATFAVALQGGLLAGLAAAGISAVALPWWLAPESGPSLVQQVTLGLVLGSTALVVAALARTGWRHRERLSSILAAVGDAVVVTDADDRVTYLNPAAAALLGWPLDEARGRPLGDVVSLVDEDRGEPVSLGFGSVLGDEQSASIGPGLLVMHRSGGKSAVEGIANPVRDRRGRLSGTVVVLRDIAVRHDAERERRRLTREVAASRERLQQIMASVPAIVWESERIPGSGRQRLNFISQYLETLTGYTVDEALATPDFWLEKMHPDDRAAAVKGAMALLEQGNSAVTQFRWIARDGRELWIESLWFVVRGPAGAPIGLRGVSMDITDRARQDADRSDLLSRERQARMDAEEANRLKDEFLMTLSHELRTPLNAILGWACLLRDSDLPADKQRKAIETIERNARAQTQLIEDLLDMSRIVTGKVRLEIGTVDVAAAVQGVVEAMRPGAGAKGVRLESVRDPEIEVIPGDTDRIQQVIWNLVSNAIKFTPTGGRVEVRVRQLYDRVLVAVSDSGLGMGPDLLPYVFERFRQGPHGGRGLGLGLAIAKQIVELHGGTIEARSLGENMGSTFLVKLPLYARRPLARTGDAEARTIGEPPAVPDNDLTGVRVLVVDAARDSLELLQVMLEQAGATVATAASDADALALAAQWEPDVLLAGLSAQGGSGLQLIRALREREARERRPRLPAVGIGAFGRSEDRRATLDSGWDDHMAKPLSSPQLVATIRTALGRDGRTVAAERPRSL